MRAGNAANAAYVKLRNAVTCGVLAPVSGQPVNVTGHGAHKRIPDRAGPERG